MFSRHKSMSFALAGVPLIASLIAVAAYAASPAPSPAPPSSPTVVHYHYHVHQQGSAPAWSQQYSGYTGASSWGAMAPYAATPTQANPYPAGYLPGPFAPTGFQNLAPGAPPAQGIIHVFLPTADAVVYVNGQQIRGKGNKDRKFTTPMLQPNQEYQYWVTATFKQDGESVTQYRKVIVGAGEYNVADFTRPPEQNPIRLPPGPVDPNRVVPPTPE